MIILATPHFVLKTRYFVNNNGQPSYQRAIPKDLRRFFKDHRKITRKLTGKHTSFALEIAQLAREDSKLFAELRGSAGVSAQVEAKARALLAYYGVRPGDGLIRAEVPPGMWDQPHLTDFEHYLEVRASHGTTDEADRLARHLLTKPMPICLSEVLSVYFRFHEKGNSQKFKKTARAHWKNIITVLGDMPIEKLDREMANRYVETRLKQGVLTTTVAREVNTIRAALGVVIRENSLGLSNQFESLTIRGLGEDSKQRLPFTHEEHRALIVACIAKADDIRMLTLLCALTGARISEIAGLRVCDTDLAAEVPHINITDYGTRSLKTKQSRRQVPLVNPGVQALRGYLESVEGEFLFPRYAGVEGVKGDNASNTINNFVRTIAPGKTSHSFRHAMQDLMRHAGVQKSVSDEIGGWGKLSHSDRYGQGYTLAQKLEALSQALKPVI